MRAKALDLWIAEELRRSGFGSDDVWPRANAPRVIPSDIAKLLKVLKPDERDAVQSTLARKPSGIVGADARFLGRAYYKQVDVGLSHWSTGPEILISTKRMDSSLGNNAFNRIEESYGDTHNLRGRHPLAALGYVLLTSTHAIGESPRTASRLFDLVARLAKEEGGYDASAVVVVDWDLDIGLDDVAVQVREDLVDDQLSMASFFKTIVAAVLDRTPLGDHDRARSLRAGAT